MKRLVLVRHGESRWNREGRVQGQACEGLSPLGHAQARVTAAALAGAHPDAEVVASDLLRATQTAAPLAAELGGRSVSTDERLRERSFGDWEGRLREEVAAGDPDRWQRWLAGEEVVHEVGGESTGQLADRVAPVLLDLLDATPDDGVTILVTHGGPIWHGLHRALGLPIPSFAGVANASVSELVTHGEQDVAEDDLRAARAVLDRWNEVAHLPVELRTAWRPRATPVSTAPVGG
ncbi:MAG: histidine phosphatase family protein [Nitriliruptoraceae bacterium]